MLKQFIVIIIMIIFGGGDLSQDFLQTSMTVNKYKSQYFQMDGLLNTNITYSVCYNHWYTK